MSQLLPLFADQYKGWKVVEDLGQPLSGDWDPRPFLDGLVIGSVHTDGAEYMKGEDLVTEARKCLKGRGGLSQHELGWFCRHWDDERIPKWFRDAVGTGEVALIATETILTNGGGHRYALCLYCKGVELRLGCCWLGGKDWDRCCQVLISSDSPS